MARGRQPAANTLESRIQGAQNMSLADWNALVSTEWLAGAMTSPNVRLLDASWHMPAANRDAAQEYRRCHIPGAAFFDIDAISDGVTHLPHMLPGVDDFARAVGGLGIGNDDHVVVYDRHGLMSAPRVWWTFRVFGHARVSVLDGGLPKWRREGWPLAERPGAVARKIFTARFRPELVSGKSRLLGNIREQGAQVIDARSAGRFYGRVPEPRPGLRGGHIPRSLNLPFERLFDGETLRVRPAEELRALFADIGLDPGRPVIATCGSGITACVLALGLHLIGAEDVSVYDGAWAEWGASPETPVATL